MLKLFGSVTQLCPTLCNRPPCPSPTHWVYSISCPLSQWCHPTISSSVVPFSSHLQYFLALGSLNESVLYIRWPKYSSFSFSIRPSNKFLGLIYFQMDWLDLRAVQDTVKNLLHYSSKPSFLRRSVLFVVQLWGLYMTTGKTIALTRWTFVGEVMSLLFNMPSRLVIAFLPRSKRLWISWWQSPFAVILGPPPPKWSLSLFPLFPHLLVMKWWDQMPWS